MENSFGSLTDPVFRSNYNQFNTPDNLFFRGIEGQTDSSFQRKDSQLVTVGTGDSLGVLGSDGLQTQDSFGRWVNSIMTDSPGSVDDPHLESSIPIGQELSMSPMMNHLQSSVPSELFSITDVSPAWAFSNEETKVLPHLNNDVAIRHLIFCLISYSLGQDFSILLKCSSRVFPCVTVCFFSIHWHHLLQVKA